MNIKEKLREFDDLLIEYAHKPLDIDIIMQALEISEEEFDILWAEFKAREENEHLKSLV